MIDFSGQGFQNEIENSVGDRLIRLLSTKEFYSFTWFSAFASVAGINGLSPFIAQAKETFQSMTIVVGIDQKGTSKEALEAIMELGVNAYVFFQPSPHSIFHPKIYLFEGREESEVIVGSSNLTAQGLFSNVEASIVVKYVHKEEADPNLISKLKSYFQGIFDLSDPNLKPLTVELIEALYQSKIIPTEAERRKLFENSSFVEDGQVAININNPFPKRAIPRPPKAFLGGNADQKPVLDIQNTDENSSDAGYDVEWNALVWSRERLPASSVQASGEGTNPTGGLRLVQGDFKIDGNPIDQTAYFRHILFGAFDWEMKRANPYVEAATVPFDITIDHKYIGKFDLEVRHKPSGEADQGNYTTSISWGKLGELIRVSNLTGARLNMYAPSEQGEAFQIVIEKK